jgi:hypothetical protein|mmetsp:Transcript_2915/g.4621  ORF Transcript_2915/g.4621 Transcript_2915/m.4621 type:complete len:270 (-) Transcript_2915:362-1171(-)
MTKGCVADMAKTYVVAPRHKRIRADGACANVAPTLRKGPALLCNDVQDMLKPQGRAFRGLLVQRSQAPLDIQDDVDKLAESGAFGEEQSAQEEVKLPWGCSRSDAEQWITRDLAKKASRLAAFAVRNGLPKEAGARIQNDFKEIGMVLTKLVPSARKVVLKLDIMGESVCHRWHADHYVGRAVVTYNGRGTDFVDHGNIDMKQFESRGPSPSIIRDHSKIFTASIGDVLFMKGLLYPGAPNGLVHRSPELCWHADGKVVNRLLLKVDIE